MPFRVQHAGLTNVGMKRTHNEDNLLTLPEEQLFLVADGMGGHASGEIASQIAVEAIANFFKATRQDEEITWPYKIDKNRPYDENRFIMSVKLANLRIHEAAQREARYRGMGTTLAGMNFVDGNALIAHVGDSRVYLVRNGQLSQLTEDHSLLNDYIKARKLTEDEIANFPHKNVIVRALGMKDTVLVDLSRHLAEQGDLYLACSDGLSGMVPDPRMLEIIKANSDLQAIAQKLIEEANKNGGVDNITTVIARVVEA
ncbi:MAG TPA: Stp1/IreP family PP2C-type Ser/Thr phosphatase [Myxococcota bacterium]|nr:Stp1/IreP family PP2C-type Ser/Thr phosphatase [Myxococcota bacterium]HRY93455.1 Stp1/IreP family PP2C-type Ser/Thr phosphatase [Myxococcota bacterium]HSA20302.1 Stp1/IreP family PP2C-type Ser/Thr phosphatase [Myxococcota bacterium]